MKHLFKVLAVFAFVCLITSSYAQKTPKFGHIDSNVLLELMPEKDSAQIKLQRIADDIEKQFEAMKNEYNVKLEEYLALSQDDAVSDLVKQTNAEALQDLQVRIEKYQTKAQQNLEENRTELFKPIIEKAKTAISSVAKENGYTYVFDSGLGIILYSEPSDDILPLVKKKLGIEE